MINIHWPTGVYSGTYRGQGTSFNMQVVCLVETKLLETALLFLLELENFLESDCALKFLIFFLIWPSLFRLMHCKKVNYKCNLTLVTTENEVLT